MIALFTDFGSADIYVGQVKAKLLQVSSSLEVVDLLHDAPNFSVVPSAHLLAALSAQFSFGTVFLCVVDPGVGGKRNAVVMQADGYWFVGPDNGLLTVIASRAQAMNLWRINWLPDALSSSFHGRDLFAPIAAWIAMGEFPHDKLVAIPAPEVLLPGGDLYEIIYIDHYGNAMTGIRAGSLARDVRLVVNGFSVNYARGFSVVEPGQFFWYENSIGLVEIAVNSGSAASSLAIKIGQDVATTPA